jgi:hypothetical protein
MGTHSSRPKLKDYSFSSFSTPHYSSSLCTTKRSSVANKKVVHAGEFTEHVDSTSRHHHRRSSLDKSELSTIAKRDMVEREQSGNYFSNDHKRRLSQRKAAMRYKEEQRNSQARSSRSQESASFPQLNKENTSRLAESQTDTTVVDRPLGITRGPRGNKALSVTSQASVRTVAHKPILRNAGSGSEAGNKGTTTVQKRSTTAKKPPRRLRWSNEVLDTQNAFCENLPLYTTQNSHCPSPHHGHSRGVPDSGGGDWFDGDSGCSVGSSFSCSFF